MKIPSWKRIYYTDYQQQFQDLVSQLSDGLNSSLDSLTSAFTNNISLRDNLYAVVKDIAVTVDATGKPTSTTTFAITNSNPIDGTLVINVTGQNNNVAAPSGGVFVSFTQSGSKITISSVTGLTANIPYSIRIIAFLT